MAIEYYYSGTVEVGIWALRSEGWQQVTTHSMYISYGPYVDGGNRSFTFDTGDLDIQLGQDVQAVGLTINGGSYLDASLVDFIHLQWQSQSAGGTLRSATPNGEKSTVVVIP